MNLELRTDELITATTGGVYYSPIVLFSMIDHYTRCDKDERSMGVLLGYRHEKQNHVQIQNSFPLKYSEGENGPVIDKELMQQMYSLQHQINPSETIVGWYLIGGAFDEIVNHIHQKFEDETGAFQAVLLHVNVEQLSTAQQFPLEALVWYALFLCSSPIGLSEVPGAMFLPITCEPISNQSEKGGCKKRLMLVTLIDNVYASNDLTNVSDLESLEKSLGLVLTYLDKVGAFVENVGTGQIEANHLVGRALVNALAVIPRIDPTVFNTIVDQHRQDLKMITHLTELTRKQLAISEKLHSLIV